jgi:hypothetical protein
MKNMNKILFAAALAATLSLANNASAQYKPTGDDGITASPKVRQMLSERATATLPTSSIAVATTNSRTHGLDGLAASPKLRQVLTDRAVADAVSSSAELASASYRVTGADGITASPKFRQQLNERNATIMVAPVK